MMMMTMYVKHSEQSDNKMNRHFVIEQAVIYS